jgi:hypothetical protein
MLAAITGLAAASFYSVVETRRAANRATRQEEAASAADVGIRALLESWNVASRDSLPIGGIDSAGSVSTGPVADRARVFVIRLTGSLFWIASAGQAADATSVEANRTHNLLVEVLRPRFPARAALLSRGNVVTAAEVTIGGDDSTPPGWTDCPAADSTRAPAIILAHGRSATFDDGRPIPDVQFDSAAAATGTYESFARVGAAALAARATIAVVPGAILSPAPDTGRDCQLGEGLETFSSWGEPDRTGRDTRCEQFYPVVYAPGDLTVRGGRGQGVLLVTGRLQIEGPFRFYGVILAGGGIDATGPDVTVYGAVISGGASGVTWRATGELRRSTCVVERVAKAAARAYPVPRRAWAELL